MNDTTFIPNKKQLLRLANTYYYNAKQNALEQCNISYLSYPLDNPKRQAIPAGGLFATAADVAKFCQMMLRGGTTAKGKRILSKAAVNAMTTKQTGPLVQSTYGFGLNTWNGGFEHSGALNTDMAVYTNRGIVTVFLVQMASWSPRCDPVSTAWHNVVNQFPDQH
jgi:CubicO group peptidase (beta-lactamase class C family)